jgi:hypothetical protein
VSQMGKKPRTKTSFPVRLRLATKSFLKDYVVPEQKPEADPKLFTLYMRWIVERESVGLKVFPDTLAWANLRFEVAKRLRTAAPNLSEPACRSIIEKALHQLVTDQVDTGIGVASLVLLEYIDSLAEAHSENLSV